MEVRYCPDDRFVTTVHAMAGVAKEVEGRMRWVVTTDEGVEFILRPQSTKPTDDN